MKNIALVASLFVAVPAFAHVELGRYEGQLPDGSPCAFEVTEVKFHSNLRHPLNERVAALVDGVEVNLRHLPKVDVDASTVLFEDGVLTGADGVANGGVGAVLKMSHEEGQEGPASMTLVRHDYKTPANSTRWSCSGLRHVR